VKEIKKQLAVTHLFLGCLDIGKLEGKKKNLESNILSIVWFDESQKKKNREESCEKNLSYYEEKIFLPNMREK